MTPARAIGAGALDLGPAAAAAGVHGLPLPTGLPVGDVNAYLLEGAAPVLVDCGPNRASALGVLEAHLAALGVALDDLELLVVTHPHPDHFGLAAELVRRTGVPVACLDVGVPVLEDWDAWARHNDAAVHAGMLRHGVPPAVAEALRGDGHTGRREAEPVAVDRVLHAGEEVVLAGRPYAVLHRPGHSEGDTLLVDRSGVIVAGDHLLSGISSNAIVSTPFGAGPHPPGERPTPLLDYRRSLAQTRELDAAVVLGGHGPPVHDHRALIDERLAAHDERAAQLLALIGDDAVTAHGLAARLFGPVAARQVFATLSEVLGHLDLLVERGQATENRDADAISFRRA